MMLSKLVGGLVVALLCGFIDQYGMPGNPSAVDIWLNSGNAQSSVSDNGTADINR